MNYDPSNWVDFGIGASTVAAVLAGLLFVAAAVNAKAMAGSANLTSRATQGLVLFALPLMAGILVILPGQGRVRLGVELLALAVVTGGSLVGLIRRGTADTGPGSPVRSLGQWWPSVAATVLVGIAAITLIIGFGGGLYWYAGATIAGLAGGLVSAWLFLVELS